MTGQLLLPEHVDYYELLYLELNEEGRKFVDYFSLQLFEESRKKKLKYSGLGEKGARELALCLLNHYWNGELPELFREVVAG